MISRLSAGIAGLGTLVLGFTWPQMLTVQLDSLPAPGLLTSVIVMFGVYLLVYSVTGDWLPNLRRSKD